MFYTISWQSLVSLSVTPVTPVRPSTLIFLLLPTLCFVFPISFGFSEESAYIKCYRAVYNRSTTGLNTDARKNVASAALAATHNAPQATELAPNSRGGTRGGWHITHRQTCNTAQ